MLELHGILLVYLIQFLSFKARLFKIDPEIKALLKKG